MKHKVLIPFFLFVIVVVAAYHNAIEGDFIWDDEFLIQKNSYLRYFKHLPDMLVSSSTTGFGGQDNFYRPTQNIYYLFIFQIFGYSKVAFHIGNILLHLLNGLFFFLLALRLTRNHFVSVLGACLWLAHPTHVEAVTYISGTADPFSMLFCLISLLLLPVENVKKHWKSYLGSLAFFTLAVLSKEAIVIMPGLVCLVIFQLSEPPRLYWKKYLISLPFWFLAAFYMLLRKTLLNFDSTYDFYKTSNIYTENMHYRLYTFLATLPEYVIILFRPVKLHMERAFPVFVQFFLPPVMVGTVILVGTLALCLYLYFKKGKTFPLFSWLWFFGAFLPMMGVLIPVNSFILEHWLYVPTFGIFVVFAFWIEKSGKLHPKAPLVLGGLIVVTFTGLTIHRNKDWRTPVSFYTNVLKYSKGSARVHNNLAMAYSDLQDWPLAINHYKTAIEISDTYPQTHYNLARAYIQTGRIQEAMAHLNRSLELKPDFIYAVDLKKQLINYINQQQRK